MLEEKFVKRKVSLKAIDYGEVEPAAGGTVRQVTKLRPASPRTRPASSTSSSRRVGQGRPSQTQGEQLRVTGKKRDDLQAVIAALKEGDFGIPLQFENFRD